MFSLNGETKGGYQMKWNMAEKYTEQSAYATYTDLLLHMKHK